MDNETKNPTAGEAGNGTQIEPTDVPDVALNSEVADNHPLPERADETRGESSHGQYTTDQRARDQSIGSRFSRSVFRRRTSNQDGMAPHQVRRVATGSRVEHMDSIPEPPHSTAMQHEGPSDDPYDYMGRHQPFIERGYAELNPEYTQPATRPLWSLAKPLPRVVRESMVPTNIPHDHDHKEFEDLEAGKVPKPLSKLEQDRATREHAYFCKKHGRFHNHAHTHDSHDDNVTITEIPQGLSRVGTRRSMEHVPPSRGSHEMEPQPGEGIGLAKTFGPPHRHDKRGDNAIQVGPSTLHTHRSMEHVPPSRGSHEMEPQPGEGIGLAKTFGPPHRHDKAFGEPESHDDQPHGFEFMKNVLVNENVPLVSCGLMENHNHHTNWSVTRTKYKDELAELLAVTVQLTLGFCADLSVHTSGSGGDTAAWAWGLATMVAIYIAGGISGAHLNPAISIMLYIYRGFPIRKIPSYVIAQTLGAFIAALIAFGIYKVDIIAYGGSDLANGGTAADFITFPRYDWVTGPTAFFTEFVGTAMLAIAVMALGDDSNAPPGAGMNALIIGLVVTVLGMSFGYNTGAALNTSRDFGPRLALLALGYGGNLFTSAYWFYGPWVATITGAIVGAGIYDLMIFVGGESPINYPRCRMKRAVRLWKGRMHERIRKVPRKLGIKRRRGGAARSGEKAGD